MSTLLSLLSLKLEPRVGIKDRKLPNRGWIVVISNRFVNIRSILIYSHNVHVEVFKSLMEYKILKML